MLVERFPQSVSSRRRTCVQLLRKRASPARSHFPHTVRRWLATDAAASMCNWCFRKPLAVRVLLKSTPGGRHDPQHGRSHRDIQCATYAAWRVSLPVALMCQ